MKYRGDDSLDRMSGEYGRYMESRQRYGAGSQESDKSFHYMVKALEDFVMVLKEEAETPQQKQQLMEALQNSMR
jgi:ATPase subunit of ABC transporter with duplicated ATPase domains